MSPHKELQQICFIKNQYSNKRLETLSTQFQPILENQIWYFQLPIKDIPLICPLLNFIEKAVGNMTGVSY